MLSRTFRLHKNRDIRKTLQKGHRLAKGAVRLTYLTSRQRNPRFTVLVSTKVAKHATVRNRLKRHIRVCLSQFAHTYPTLAIDGVISVTRAVSDHEITADCQYVLGQLPAGHS